MRASIALVVLITSALTSFASRAAETDQTMPTTRPVLPLIVAHRGVPSECPENTLASFRRAWEQNADAVESDFWLTRDGKVIAIHDQNTKRTTGVDLGVSDTTFDQLRALDAGAWKGDAFKGEKLPTLAELLDTVPAGKKVFLEIKSGPEIIPAFVADIRAAIEHNKLSLDQVVVISFHDAVIPVIKKALPGVKAYLLFGFKTDDQGKPIDSPDAILDRAKSLGADGLDLGFGPKVYDVITPDFAAKVKAAGLELHVWTVDDPSVARRAIDLGVDSITTNRAGALRAELGGEN